MTKEILSYITSLHIKHKWLIFNSNNDINDNDKKKKTVLGCC